MKASEDLMTIRVPTLYSLSLGLPSQVVSGQTSVYFDCKLRKLFVVLVPKRAKEEVAPVVEQEKTVVVEVVDTKKLESDLLFDVV